MMVLPLAGLRQLLPAESAACEHTRAYLKRISERPAFQRAIHKADPDSPRQIV
jgi:predicted transcriptional regulator of viral defense system